MDNCQSSTLLRCLLALLHLLPSTAAAAAVVQDYIYLSFPSATTTRSGYDIKRKNTAVATVRNGQVYACVASARSDQYNVAKKELLERVVQSFRLRESA